MQLSLLSLKPYSTYMLKTLEEMFDIFMGIQTKRIEKGNLRDQPILGGLKVMGTIASQLKALSQNTPQSSIIP